MRRFMAPMAFVAPAIASPIACVDLRVCGRGGRVAAGRWVSRGVSWQEVQVRPKGMASCCSSSRGPQTAAPGRVQHPAAPSER